MTPADTRPTPDPLPADEPRITLPEVARSLVPPLLFSLACVLAARLNYLLFHSLAEVFSIVVAFTAMVVATTSARYARNDLVVFVSIAIGWCAGIDLVHTLAFKGMGLLPGDSANPATQLWLAARGLQALALLLAPMALRQRLSPISLHGVLAVMAVGLVAAIFTGRFPDAYLEGAGLTPFKVNSEYAVIAALGVSALGLRRIRHQLSPRVYFSLMVATAFMMASEFAFTRYGEVYAQANLVGHLLKIFAYWYVYVALVRNTLSEPFIRLQREIDAREKLAAERAALIADLGERMQEARCLNAVAELVERTELQLPQLLDGLARLLPPAFLRPDRVRVAVESEWGDFGDSRPAQAPRLELVQALSLEDRRVATLRVWYPDEAQDTGLQFLPEEEALLHNVARQACEAVRRMRAAERVQRLRYLYEMLSASNRSVIYSKSRHELLDALHESLVAHGTFPVFFFADTTEGSWPLRLTRHHGVPPSLESGLAQILRQIDGHIPQVVRGLRAGEVDAQTMAHVVETEPGADGQSLSMWRAFLHDQGIAHRAILPLRCEDRLEGIVAIYARGLAPFDEEQLRLLREICSDMSFALGNFARQSHYLEKEKQASLLQLRFEEVFQASPVPMQIMSLDDGRVRAINDAHRRFLGYALEDIGTEEIWLRQVYPDDTVRRELARHWHESIEAARTGRAVESPELTLRCKDGSSRIARGRMSVVGQDAIVVWTDLTEIRRNEAALQESERRFRTMVEQAQTALFVRRDGRFIYINPRFSEITGWSREELAGRSVLDFTEPDAGNLDKIHRAWAELHENVNKTVAYTVPFRRKDGQVIQIGLTAKVVTWDDGAPATIVLAADITERKQAEEKIAAYVRQLEAAMRGTLQAVSNMVEMRDPYTAGHERRVGLVASAIGQELGWSEERCGQLELLGLVHDIGKIAIPSEILTKPGRLSPLEMEMMKGHPQAGYDILKDVPFPMPVAEIIRQHHERVDGSGYPRGLKGDEILPEAQVLAVADVLESMASHRPYRPAVGLDAALAEVESNKSRLYAPEVVEAAVRLIRVKGYQLPK